MDYDYWDYPSKNIYGLSDIDPTSWMENSNNHNPIIIFIIRSRLWIMIPIICQWLWTQYDIIIQLSGWYPFMDHIPWISAWNGSHLPSRAPADDHHSPIRQHGCSAAGAALGHAGRWHLPEVWGQKLSWYVPKIQTCKKGDINCLNVYMFPKLFLPRNI